MNDMKIMERLVSVAESRLHSAQCKEARLVYEFNKSLASIELEQEECNKKYLQHRNALSNLIQEKRKMEYDKELSQEVSNWVDEFTESELIDLVKVIDTGVAIRQHLLRIHSENDMSHDFMDIQSAPTPEAVKKFESMIMYASLSC